MGKRSERETSRLRTRLALLARILERFLISQAFGTFERTRNLRPAIEADALLRCVQELSDTLNNAENPSHGKGAREGADGRLNKPQPVWLDNCPSVRQVALSCGLH